MDQFFLTENFTDEKTFIGKIRMKFPVKKIMIENFLEQNHDAFFMISPIFGGFSDA